MPSDVVLELPRRQRLPLFDLDATVPLDLLPDPVDSVLSHNVFESAHLPIISSAVVPLHAGDRLNDVENVFFLDEAKMFS